MSPVQNILFVAPAQAGAQPEIRLQLLGRHYQSGNHKHLIYREFIFQKCEQTLGTRLRGCDRYSGMQEKVIQN